MGISIISQSRILFIIPINSYKITTKYNKVNIEVIINIFKKYNLIINNNNLFNNQFFLILTL